MKLRGTQAVLNWPKPIGAYTKQVIEKWKVNTRQKLDCVKARNCEEEVIPIEQTSHTTDIEKDKEYKFILVLYDGEVKVAQFKLDKVIITGRLAKVM